MSMELKTKHINLNIVDMCFDGKEIFFQGFVKDKIAIGDFLEHCKSCSDCSDTLNRYIGKLKPYLFANLLSIKSFLT